MATQPATFTVTIAVDDSAEINAIVAALRNTHGPAATFALDAVGGELLEDPIPLDRMQEPAVCVGYLTGDGSGDCEIAFDLTWGGSYQGHCQSCTDMYRRYMSGSD